MWTSHGGGHRRASSGCGSVRLVVLLLLLAMEPSVVATRKRSGIDHVLRDFQRVTLSPVDGRFLLDAGWRLASTDRQRIHLRVDVFDRTFAVTLKRGRSVYLPDAKIVVHDVAGGAARDMAASEFSSDAVEGYVVGDPDSYVHGHVVDGAFDGIISTADENYYVEPASRFFDDADGVYDAVVYRESDVNFRPNIRPRQQTKTICSDALTVGDWFAVSNDTWSNEDGSSLKIDPEVDNDDVDVDDGEGDGVVHPMVISDDDDAVRRVGRVCKVKAVVDHTMFRDKARGDLRRAVGHVEFHVREADRMFSVTDFDFDERADDVRIRLAALEVFKSRNEHGYLLRDETLDATAYLMRFTMYNHDGMCAALAFTHRQFKDDVLGFAYRGGPNHAGGICYPRRSVNGKIRSLNVGLTSTNAPWGTLAVAQSVVVLTHELGHMFGAMHDEDADGGACFHNDRRRHYIMSSLANPGRTTMNRMFSKCSRRTILKNLKVNGQCLYCRGHECGHAATSLFATGCTALAFTLAIVTLRWTTRHAASFYLDT